MSAREHLFNVAADHMPVTSDEVNEAIDDYAHELAEEGRKVMGPRALPSGVEPDSIRRYVAGWHDAMDHVDPEVSTNG